MRKTTRIPRQIAEMAVAYSRREFYSDGTEKMMPVRILRLTKDDVRRCKYPAQVGYLTKVRLGQIQPAGFEPLFEYLQQHLQSIM